MSMPACILVITLLIFTVMLVVYLLKLLNVLYCKHPKFEHKIIEEIIYSNNGKVLGKHYITKCKVCHTTITVEVCPISNPLNK